MKILLAVVICAAVAYALVLLAAYFFADALMFHPPARTYVKTGEIVEFESDSGAKLAGIFLKSPVHTSVNIFYCHGNGEDLGMVYSGLNRLRELGCNVFSFDYDGYGLSGGKPSEENLYKSARSAWKYAEENLGFTPQNTFLFGFSLGSAAVCSVAETRKFWRGIILAGGIARGVETVLSFDAVPWKILDNTSKIAHFECPLLIMHGTRDFIVPPRNARRNFAAAKCAKKLVWLDGYGHNDISASPEYRNAVMQFIKGQQ